MLSQDSELADCLQTAEEEITGKPSPISWPRKVRVHHLGQAAYDSKMYKRGYTISFPGIPGFTVNLDSPETVEKPAEKSAEEPAKKKGK
jgi:hypothetical protein